MDIRLSVNKGKILESAKMSISVMVRDEVDSNGNSLYPIVMPTERDDAMLTILYDSCINDIVVSLKSLSPVVYDDKIELFQPNFSMEQIDTAEKLLADYVKDGIVGGWLKIKGSDVFQFFLDNASGELLNLKNILFNKKAPCMKEFRSDVSFAISVNEINAGSTSVDFNIYAVKGDVRTTLDIQTLSYMGIHIDGLVGGFPINVEYLKGESGVIKFELAQEGAMYEIYLIQGRAVIDKVKGEIKKQV